jgi:hypothetical protein
MRTLAIVFAACLLIVPSMVRGQLGLFASPNPLNFNVLAGSNSSTQVVNITNNGSPVTINSLSTSTTTGQTWLQASFDPSTGVVTTTVNPAGLSGSFSGTVFVTTVVGQIAVAVNLTVGTPPVTPAPTSLILVLTGLAAVGLYQMKRRKFSVAVK